MRGSIAYWLETSSGTTPLGFNLFCHSLSCVTFLHLENRTTIAPASKAQLILNALIYINYQHTVSGTKISA